MNLKGTKTEQKKKALIKLLQFLKKQQLMRKNMLKFGLNYCMKEFLRLPKI